VALFTSENRGRLFGKPILHERYNPPIILPSARPKSNAKRPEKWREKFFSAAAFGTPNAKTALGAAGRVSINKLRRNRYGRLPIFQKCKNM
jgi:hypothetical protein